MNYFKKLMLSTAVCASILGTSASAVYAEDFDIIFEGNDESFTVNAGSEHTSTDLFSEFKEVMPGDELKQTVKIKNISKDSDFIKLYMHVEEHDESSNPLEAAEEAEASNEFLSQLDLKIYQGDKLIFSGSPDKANDLKERILLGDFRHGETEELVFALTVPADLDNDFANRLGEMDIVFSADLQNDPKAPNKSDGSHTSVINNPVIWIAAAATCLAVLLLLFLKSRKKKA